LNLGGGHLKSRGAAHARPEILPHQEVRRFRDAEEQGRGPGGWQDSIVAAFAS